MQNEFVELMSKETELMSKEIRCVRNRKGAITFFQGGDLRGINLSFACVNYMNWVVMLIVQRFAQKVFSRL